MISISIPVIFSAICLLYMISLTLSPHTTLLVYRIDHLEYLLHTKLRHPYDIPYREQPTDSASDEALPTQKVSVDYRKPSPFAATTSTDNMQQQTQAVCLNITISDLSTPNPLINHQSSHLKWNHRNPINQIPSTNVPPKTQHPPTTTSPSREGTPISIDQVLGMKGLRNHVLS